MIVKAGDHINVCEVRASLEVVCGIAPHYRSLPVLVLVDALAALGSVAKGRSASSKLNKLLSLFAVVHCA